MEALTVYSSEQLLKEQEQCSHCRAELQGLSYRELSARARGPPAEEEEEEDEDEDEDEEEEEEESPPASSAAAPAERDACAAVTHTGVPGGDTHGGTRRGLTRVARGDTHGGTGRGHTGVPGGDTQEYRERIHTVVLGSDTQGYRVVIHARREAARHSQPTPVPWRWGARCRSPPVGAGGLPDVPPLPWVQPGCPMSLPSRGCRRAARCPSPPVGAAGLPDVPPLPWMQPGCPAVPLGADCGALPRQAAALRSASIPAAPMNPLGKSVYALAALGSFPPGRFAVWRLGICCPTREAGVTVQI
ncbi:uncharacterized protein GJ701_013755 [Geothlypis trichas]